MENQWENIVEIRQKLRDAYLENWLNNNLFSFNWWVILVSIIAFSILWWKLLDKGRIFEILTYGLLVAVVAVVFDTIGDAYVLFGYPNSLLPIFPSIATYTSLLPFAYMLMYQTFTGWKSFCIANVILAIFLAFIIEPILVWMGIYEYHKWNYFYSFLVYPTIGIPLKWLMTKLLRAEG